jgi:hypothetical protein
MAAGGTDGGSDEAVTVQGQGQDVGGVCARIEYGILL